MFQISIGGQGLDRRARFLSFDDALKVFQEVIIRFVLDVSFHYIQHC